MTSCKYNRWKTTLALKLGWGGGVTARFFVPNYAEFEVGMFSVRIAHDLDQPVELPDKRMVQGRRGLAKSITTRSKFLSRETGKQSVAAIRYLYHGVHTGVGNCPRENLQDLGYQMGWRVYPGSFHTPKFAEH